MIVLYIGREVKTSKGNGKILSIYRKSNDPIKEDVVVQFDDGSTSKFRDEELKEIPINGT